MLRYLVLILLVVNAAFLAWSQGWLKPVVGVQPDAQHEPGRLEQQRHADRIIVLSAGGARAASAAAEPPASATEPASSPEPSPASASAPASASPPASAGMADAATGSSAGICLQAGPFRNEDMAQVTSQMTARLGAALRASQAADTWTTQAVPLSGVWLVYMGPYPDEDLYAKKLNELRRIKGLDFDEVSTPSALAHGLSLGRYTSLAEAQVGLAAMKMRGIRTARIVVLRAPAEMQMVRVAHASQRTQVALSAVKLPQGKAFSACRP